MGAGGWAGGPEPDDPFVLQLVVGTDKAAPVRLPDLCAAVVGAVAGARAERPGAFAAYEAERIRKLARHTTPARLAALATDEDVVAAGVTGARVGTADVVAVGPVRRAATPRAVARTQLSASPERFAGELPQAPDDDGDDGPRLHVAVDRRLGMSPLKLAAQTGHAAQLTHRLLAARDPAALERWRENGWRATVYAPLRFAVPDDERVVVVRDAGFTEIPAGSLTVWARLR